VSGLINFVRRIHAWESEGIGEVRRPRGIRRLNVPWEFVTGIRSWALPGLFAGLMELARIGGIPPENYLTVIYTFMDIM
jgi:hypothetical protein